MALQDQVSSEATMRKRVGQVQDRTERARAPDKRPSWQKRQLTVDRSPDALDPFRTAPKLGVLPDCWPQTSPNGVLPDSWPPTMPNGVPCSSSASWEPPPTTPNGIPFILPDLGGFGWALDSVPAIEKQESWWNRDLWGLIPTDASRLPSCASSCHKVVASGSGLFAAAPAGGSGSSSSSLFGYTPAPSSSLLGSTPASSGGLFSSLGNSGSLFGTAAAPSVVQAKAIQNSQPLLEPLRQTVRTSPVYKADDFYEPGSYEIIREAAVSDRSSTKDCIKVADLHIGAIVNVIEVVRMPDIQRIRARIAVPDGWISLLDMEGGCKWARPKVLHDELMDETEDSSDDVDEDEIIEDAWTCFGCGFDNDRGFCAQCQKPMPKPESHSQRLRLPPSPPDPDASPPNEMMAMMLEMSKQIKGLKRELECVREEAAKNVADMRSQFAADKRQRLLSS